MKLFRRTSPEAARPLSVGSRVRVVGGLYNGLCGEVIDISGGLAEVQFDADSQTPAGERSNLFIARELRVLHAATA